MARQYAVMLGLLAFGVVQIRTMWHGYDAAGNLWLGMTMMIVMALVGAVVGGLAEWTLGQELRQELAAQMAAAQQGDSQTNRTRPKST